jgi:peptide chain release factor subunit 1
VFAGNSAFKTELSETPTLDQRLKPCILSVLDISYGGENGLNEAISLASQSLSSVKFV